MPSPLATVNILPLAPVQSQDVLIGCHMLYWVTIGPLHAATWLWNKVEQQWRGGREEGETQFVIVFLGSMSSVSCVKWLNVSQCVHVTHCVCFEEITLGLLSALCVYLQCGSLNVTTRICFFLQCFYYVWQQNYYLLVDNCAGVLLIFRHL